MATVKQILTPADALYPSSNYPAPVVFQGTNFPISGLAFDDTTSETVYFRFPAVNYGSGNITISIDWYADTATANSIVFGASIAAITQNTDSQDIETKAFATENTSTDTHLGTTGQRLHSFDIVVSNLDSIASNDDVTLRLRRLPSDASDTMTGDAIVTRIIVSYSDT